MTGLPEPSGGGVDPVDALLTGESEARLQEAVAALPPKLRAVFLLRHLDDLSYDEIAIGNGAADGNGQDAFVSRPRPAALGAPRILGHMTCRDTEELIQQGIDGTLTPAERATLDTHLAACAGCRTAWEEHHRLAHLALQWISEAGRTPEIGEAFTAQVLARIAARPSPVPSRPVFWLPLAAAGLLAVTLALLPYLVEPALPNHRSVKP